MLRLAHCLQCAQGGQKGCAVLLQVGHHFEGLVKNTESDMWYSLYENNRESLVDGVLADFDMEDTYGMCLGEK